MILNGILLLAQGLLELLLAPLSAINIVVDFLSSIPVVFQFFTIVCYIIPWSSIMPLILLVFTIISFKISIAILKTVWSFIPFV